jgi:glycine/D-amino acid oxidase-like deaminating enzyme
VIATNGYTSQLGLPKPRIAKVMVQLFRTAPLTDAQLDALDWRARTGIYTAHEILESYRLTADKRIVGGSKAVRYGFGNRTLPDVDPRGAAALERAFRARFPELAEVPVTDHWGGVTGFSLDFLPQIGRTGRSGNILYAAGFCGHGIAQASYAGPMVRDLLLERDGPGRVLWERRSIPFPPEPLRWIVANGLIKLFQGMDRRIDG